jgi:recombination protein RecR
VVVEHDVDIDALEASLTYKGYYFVLGGLMPLSKQKKMRTIHDVELLKRIKDMAGITEVIFALATTPEGDYTAKELITKIQNSYPSIKTTILGRGLSVGAEVEYADPETLRSALKNRS